MKIAFFGTSRYAVKPLESIIEAFEVCAVITTPDKPAGRKQILTPSPVKRYIQENHPDIKLLQPEKVKNNSALLSELNRIKADIFVVSAYGKIIPESIFSLPEHKTLCLHPSLLPKYRGPTPIETALLNGEKITGNTVFLMTEKVDSGPILSKSEVEVELEDDYETLTEKLSNDGAKLLVKTVDEWVKGKINPVNQDDENATYTSFFKTEDAVIDWSRSADEVHNKVRAFRGNLNAYTFFRGKRILILKTLPTDDSGGSAGEVLKSDKKTLLVRCGKGAVKILEVQPAGKKPMTNRDFWNGYRPKAGEKFGL